MIYYRKGNIKRLTLKNIVKKDPGWRQRKKTNNKKWSCWGNE